MWKTKALEGEAKVAILERERKARANTHTQLKRSTKKNEQLRITLGAKQERMAKLIQERAIRAITVEEIGHLASTTM